MVCEVICAEAESDENCNWWSPPPFLSQKSCSKIISKRTTLLHIFALYCICMYLHCIAYFGTLLHVSTLYCISLHCIVPAMGTVRSMMVLRTATDCLSYNSPSPSTHPPIRPPMNRCNKVIGNTLARAAQCKELWSNLEMTLGLVNIEMSPRVIDSQVCEHHIHYLHLAMSVWVKGPQLSVFARGFQQIDENLSRNFQDFFVSLLKLLPSVTRSCSQEEDDQNSRWQELPRETIGPWMEPIDVWKIHKIPDLEIFTTRSETGIILRKKWI